MGARTQLSVLLSGMTAGVVMGQRHTNVRVAGKGVGIPGVIQHPQILHQNRLVRRRRSQSGGIRKPSRIHSAPLGSIPLPQVLELCKSQSHRRFGLEGSLKLMASHYSPLSRDAFQQPRLLPATSSLALDISRDRAPIAALGNLCQVSPPSQGRSSSQYLSV